MNENQFPQSTDTIVATLIQLFRHQNNQAVCDVLENSKARIEQTGYDNWDNGIYLYTLFLDVPVKLFARIEPDVPRLEQVIANKFPTILRNPGTQHLRQAAISPVLEQSSVVSATKVAPSDTEHLWELGMFRLFISHVASHKIAVSKLKSELRILGISGFVAHEDIEPNSEWQREIEMALHSMHALVALLTPDFHQSNWTDQEVGFAFGKTILVISVRLGLDPYGFIGKQQGLPGSLELPQQIASGIVDILLKQKTTDNLMREALVVALEKSSSFAASKLVVSKIETVNSFTDEQLSRMTIACKSNSQVEHSFGVASRIQSVVQRFKPPTNDDMPF
jgi:hypothetical protein